MITVGPGAEAHGSLCRAPGQLRAVLEWTDVHGTVQVQYSVVLPYGQEEE